jgi:hypothetical protein
MERTYNVIDSDDHVLEPRTFWQDYIDPKFRDQAPKLIIDEKGKDRFLIIDDFYFVTKWSIELRNWAIIEKEEQCHTI